MPGKTASLLAGLLLLVALGPTTAQAAISEAQLRRAERSWLEASGWVLARRRAAGCWDAGLDPALSGLIGGADGIFTTSLGQKEAKQTAAQSGWCRVVACLLDSLRIGPRDTVAVTMTGSFPGLNLAVLLTLEAGGIPYRSVASLGASTYGANDSTFNWPLVEGWLRQRGLLRQGSCVVTPGGSGDRLNGLPLETQRAAEAVLRATPASLHPSNLPQAVELRREALGPREHLALLINVGGGHPVMGGNDYGRTVPGGLLGDADGPGDPGESGSEGEVGTKGVLQLFHEEGLPVLHFIDIVRLARRWGLPSPPQSAQTPPEVARGCRPAPATTRRGERR
ncbi:MAG: poly-gamma-glutamate system protein [Candidatus Delongbacteria bacterium]